MSESSPLFDEIRKELDLGQINVNHPIRAKIDAAEAAYLDLKNPARTRVASMDKIRTMKALGVVHPEIADMLLTLEGDMVGLVSENDALRARIAELEDSLEFKPAVILRTHCSKCGYKLPTATTEAHFLCATCQE